MPLSIASPYVSINSFWNVEANAISNNLGQDDFPSNSNTMMPALPILLQGRGIGSQLHHLSYCFLASYGTQRTLILDTKNYNGNPDGLETLFRPLSETCTTYNRSEMVIWPGKRRHVSKWLGSNTYISCHWFHMRWNFVVLLWSVVRYIIR